MSECKHNKRTDGPIRPFSGSVCNPPYTDENRRAHGGCSTTETCELCGATRSVNRNQGEEEVSTWGPSRNERIARARSALRRAPPPKPFEATATYGRDVRISCEPDGMLWVEGASIEELRSILPPGWIEAAQAYRRAVLGMEEAER